MQKPLRVFVLLTLLILFTISPLAIHADTPKESPLLQMLALVPDTALVRDSELSYTDFRALVAARPGAAQPKNYQEWNSLKTSESKEGELAKVALMGIATGSPDLLMQFFNPELMLNAVGIDPFTIERSVFYGAPPKTALILTGAFDKAAVGKALQAKGYEVKDSGYLELWCAAAGCDTGTKLDLKARDPNNPFGGQLGRKQPIAVAPSIVFSSPSFESMQAIFDVNAKQQSSLANNADFKTATEAITKKGALLQAYFVSPTYLTPPDLSKLGDRAKELVEKLREHFTPLPPYSLVVFAHAATPDQQLAEIALVYNDESTAKSAITTMQTNIENYASLTVMRPLKELIEQRGGTIETPHVYTANGKSVVVFTISGKIESQEKAKDAPSFQTSGLLFNLFIKGLQNRDLGWLSTQPPQ